MAYLVGVTVLGLWYSRGIKSSEDYFLAGRSLPWWAAGVYTIPEYLGRRYSPKVRTTFAFLWAALIAVIEICVYYRFG